MRKYAEYKNSGVEWLGEIPEHWLSVKLKFTGENFIGLTYSPKDIVDENNGTLVLRSSNIQDGRISYKDCVYIDMEIPNKLITLEGDILLCARNGSADLVGKNICISKDTAGVTFGAFMTIYRSKYWRYFSYFFNSEIFKAQSGLFATSTINQLTNETLKSMKVALPLDMKEQQSIITFLDYKTAQIDQFIANRQKQIELLKEQKISIINFAITRGTNKNTKYKNSETLTLDFYPEHWKLTKIKYLLKKKRAAIRTGPFGTQLKNSDLKEDGEIKIYNQRSVIDKNFNGGTEYISLEKYENLKDFTVNPNDLLITTRGTIGKCAVFPNDAEIGVLHPCLIRMQLDTRLISNEYAMICLESGLFFQEEIKLLSNSTVIEVIYSYNLKEVFLPVPPTLKEQQEIINYINEETSKTETLISKYQSQITIMQEYRTALISQAVTGKIDVRDWKPKNLKTT